MSGIRALVIGGTGPTGPYIVDGLVERGYQVSVLHAGLHEVSFSSGSVEHVHVDPHFADTLASGLGNRTFDLVVAQYGRLRVIADFMVGRAGRVVAVGGATAIYASPDDPRWGALGRPELVPEGTNLFAQAVGDDKSNKLGVRMAEAMDALFEHHHAGAYSVTYLMYPLNYGPRNPAPYDWSIIRRVLDKRQTFVVADGGMKLESRVASVNAAHAVLLAIDLPDKAAGRRYVVTDPGVYSMRRRIEFIASRLNHRFELVDMPYEAAWPCHPLWRHTRGHRLCEGQLIRHELGYREPVDQATALAESVDWLVANQPRLGSEAERQIGDPFDYAAEDALVKKWRRRRRSLAQLEVRELPRPGHQYRHPKEPGEEWKPVGGQGGVEGS